MGVCVWVREVGGSVCGRECSCMSYILQQQSQRGCSRNVNLETGQ